MISRGGLELQLIKSGLKHTSTDDGSYDLFGFVMRCSRPRVSMALGSLPPRNPNCFHVSWNLSNQVVRIDVFVAFYFLAVVVMTWRAESLAANEACIQAEQPARDNLPTVLQFSKYMEISRTVTNTDHEQVLLGRDVASGYHGIIAIHSTALGPAVGGTRFWNYASEEEALADSLRLSRGMTYKNALARLPLGGGKSIIIGDNKSPNREALLRAHGRFVETLGGRYITAEDVGTNPTDMEIVRQETRHVAGLLGRSGDPSPFTARGVFRAIQASVKYLWNSDYLSGVVVSLQGCGNVGYHLAKSLRAAGSKLIVTDVDAAKISRVVNEFGAVAVQPNEIFGVRADIFAPCALGGVVNDQTIPQFRVRIVAGAANNQLLEERHGEMLTDRDILYAPDYAANAGGVINGCVELLGWEPARASRRVDEIYDTILTIFGNAKADGIATNKAADRLAEDRLQKKADELEMSPG
jgi:leucine dehydrogenase